MKTNFTNKKAVIFDLDGTIADTINAIAKAVNLTMKNFGYPERTESDVRGAIGNGATNLIRRLVPYEISSDSAKVSLVRQDYDKMYALTYLETRELYDGMYECIKELVEKRNLNVAVFSNKQDVYVKKLCGNFFKNGEIRIALGQTDLPIKPDIAGLVKIMDELGVSSDECVFVGDSEVDQKTAENAQMDFIGVAWGYAGEERLALSGAEIIINHPKEILDIISGGENNA